MKELLEIIAKALVDNPDEVAVNEIEVYVFSGNGTYGVPS